MIVFKDNDTNKFYFEIGYLNELNTFIIEYLIDITYDKDIIKNINNFDRYFNEFNNKIILTTPNSSMLKNKIFHN